MVALIGKMVPLQVIVGFALLNGFVTSTGVPDSCEYKLDVSNAEKYKYVENMNMICQCLTDTATAICDDLKTIMKSTKAYNYVDKFCKNIVAEIVHINKTCKPRATVPPKTITEGVTNSITADPDGSTVTTTEFEITSTDMDTTDPATVGKTDESATTNESETTPTYIERTKGNPVTDKSKGTPKNDSVVENSSKRPVTKGTPTSKTVPALETTSETSNTETSTDGAGTTGARKADGDEKTYSLAAILWSIFVSFAAGVLIAVVAKMIYNRYRKDSYVLPPDQEVQM